jgi:hypothetical protein
MRFANLLAPRAARHPVNVDSWFVSDGERTAITLVNVTHDGFMATGECEVSRGQTGYLMLADGEQLKAEIRWVRGNSFGARFVPAIRTFTLGRIIAGHS